MKEEIQEMLPRLAVEAGFSFDGEQIRAGEGAISYRLRQFARLIAAECAKIAESTTEQGSMDAGGETKAYATAVAIEEAFGLWEASRR